MAQTDAELEIRNAFSIGRYLQHPPSGGPWMICGEGELSFFFFCPVIPCFVCSCQKQTFLLDRKNIFYRLNKTDTFPRFVNKRYFHLPVLILDKLISSMIMLNKFLTKK